MEEYHTSSDSFKEYLSINGIAWDDCEIEILMESIDEKPVRDYEMFLNWDVFKDNEFCWSRNTLAGSQECLQNRYYTLSRKLGRKAVSTTTLDEMAYSVVQMRQRLELQRLEQERLELKRLKREQLEQERLKREQLEQERLELKRLKREQLELKRLKRQQAFRQEHPELFDWEPSEDFT